MESRRWVWLSILLSSGALALLVAGGADAARFDVPGGTSADVGHFVASAAERAGLLGAGVLLASIGTLWAGRTADPVLVRRAVLFLVGTSLLVTIADLGGALQIGLLIGAYSPDVVPDSIGWTMTRFAATASLALMGLLSLGVGNAAVHLIDDRTDPRTLT